MSVYLADGFGLGERREEARLLVLLTSCRLLAAGTRSLALAKRQAASGRKVKASVPPDHLSHLAILQSEML